MLEWDFENKHQFDCVIDPFGKMKANLELAMVWLLVSPKNGIVIRLNLVYEGMMCEIVHFY